MIENIKLKPFYREECIRPFQIGHEFVHESALRSLNISQFVRGFCCVGNRWQKCIVNKLSQHCGKESEQTIVDFIHQSTVAIFKYLCPIARYDPSNPRECPPEIVGPSEGLNKIMPKGLNSGSFFSHYFSFLCPNIGWGLID